MQVTSIKIIKLPTRPRIASRWWGLFAGVAFVAIAIDIDPAAAIMGAGGLLVVALVVIDWRVGRILRAANKLTRKFLLSKDPYYEELRELAIATMLRGGK